MMASNIMVYICSFNGKSVFNDPDETSFLHASKVKEDKPCNIFDG